MPASWKLTCFLVITMCVSALGHQLVSRDTNIFQERDMSVTKGKRAVVKVAEVPTSVGIVQKRECFINKTAVADFANESNVDIATQAITIDGSERIVVNISEVTEEFRGVSVLCKVRIRSRPIRVYKVNLKVINEDCPQEGLTSSSDVRIDPDKPSYGSGEEIKYGCDEDSWTLIGPPTRTCWGPEWHPPLSRRTSCLGRLAAPGNVSAEANGTVIFLNWSVPLKFSHGISNEHPDVSNYTVYIHNIATNKSGMRNATNSSFIFTGLLGEDQNPCHNYSFTVIANNAIGKGERSEEVIQHFEGECQAVTEDTKRLFTLLGVLAFVVVCAIVVSACWKKFGASKEGAVSQGDDRDNNTDEVALEKNGTHNHHQKNESKAQVPTPDGPLRTLSIIAGGDVETDGVTSSFKEETGVHNPNQENGNKAEVPTQSGPIPPPGMQQKGVGGHGLRRRHQKDYLHCEPELIDFKKLVATKSEKWRELGLELKLSRTSLDKIANRATSLEKRFTAVFEELTKKSVTWEEIIQALGSPRVGESTLAGSVKDTLTYY